MQHRWFCLNPEFLAFATVFYFWRYFLGYIEYILFCILLVVFVVVVAIVMMSNRKALATLLNMCTFWFSIAASLEPLLYGCIYMKTDDTMDDVAKKIYDDIQYYSWGYISVNLKNGNHYMKWKLNGRTNIQATLVSLTSIWPCVQNVITVRYDSMIDHVESNQKFIA